MCPTVWTVSNCSGCEHPFTMRVGSVFTLVYLSFNACAFGVWSKAILQTRTLCAMFLESLLRSHLSGSVVKNTRCSYRSLEIHSQHPGQVTHNNSSLKSFDASTGTHTHAHMWHTQTHMCTNKNENKPLKPRKRTDCKHVASFQAPCYAAISSYAGVGLFGPL